MLFNDLKVDHLVVNNACLSIYFKACNLYPDTMIVCLLNRKMLIEDYYVE